MAYDDLKSLAHQFRAAKETPEGRNLRLEYAVMMCISAAQAVAMQARTMTVIEFGVYRGDGLRALVDIGARITGLKFQFFGFDTGTGLPKPRDYRDHPEIWHAGNFDDVDYNWLRRVLPDHATLVIGYMAETVPAFSHDRLDAKAPVAFVAVDSDLYSSAVSALKLFEADPMFFVPAPMVYFDDVDDIATFNSRCGEALAIQEFNARNQLRFIERRRSELHGYYTCHVLDHPARSGAGGHTTMDIRIADF